MTAILAIFNRDGQPAEPSVAEAMLAPSRDHAPDGQDVWTGGSVVLAHQHFWVTPEEQGERQPLADAPGRYAITADARLDNRAELIEALGLSGAEGRALSDAALILRAYARWGEECASCLLGDFAFIVWDGVERRLFLARDPMGARGLAYARVGPAFLAATNVDGILAHPAVRPRINERKIARFLAGDWDEEEETFFEGIRYLPPAHCMAVSPDGVQARRYWDVDPGQRIRYRSDAEYAGHFAHLLTEAVRCRLRAVGTAGLALSGGSDSTALAAVATAVLPETGLPQERLKTFSYVFDELPTCDEREFIRPVVEALGLEATFIPCDDRWPLRDLERWPVERDFVVSDAYIWLPTAVMRAAQAAGCRLLMTGHNGDALFWDDEYWMLALLREGRAGDVVKRLLAMQGRSSLWEAMGGDALRSAVPERARRAYRRLRPRPRPPWHRMWHPDFVARTRLDELPDRPGLDRRFRTAEQRHHYETLIGNGLLQGRHVARRMYARHGLELIEPYYDRRLVAFAMAIPAHQWGRPGRSKWVLRNAMTGRLPPQVVERRSATAFTALWERGLAERERATVEALLRDPEIVRRGIVRAEWLQEELQPGHASADEGYRLWLCISLELWLRRWGQALA